MCGFCGATDQRGLRLSVLGIKNPHDMCYDQYEDDLPEEVYQMQQIEILNELHRVLKDGGTVWYNHKPRRAGFKEYFPTEWILKSKLNIYGQIIWNMKRSVNQHTGFATPTHEFLYQLTKTNRPPVFIKKRLPMEFRSSVWTILPERVKGHPCVSTQ
jgi:site-specific DNA-methyltransferase (adenine-specific)